MKKSIILSSVLIWFIVLFWTMKVTNAQGITTDTLEIESVTIYKNRTIADVPAGAKIVRVDSLVFREKLNLSLSELLIENSPIFIKTYGRGATATASFRGTGASHTLVSWNGLKINSPMSGEVDFSLIPLYFVDDISIHFGQSSMKFGSGGLGGAVNLKSSPDWDKKFGANIYQSFGSFQTYSTAVKSTYGNTRIKGQTRIFRESSLNNFSYKNIAKIDTPIEIQQNADYEKLGLLHEVFVRPNSNNIISAKVWLQENEKGIPRLMSNYSSNEINRQNDRILNSIAEWETYGEIFKLSASSGLSHRTLNYNLQKTSIEGNKLPVIESNSNAWSWYNKLNASYDFADWIDASLTGEFNYHKVNSNEKVLGNNYQGSQKQGAIRISTTIEPVKRVSISAIVHQEIVDQKITPIIPTLTAEYRFLAKENLVLKSSVGRNYHYPSLNDMYWQPGGNPNLKPENGLTLEGGFQYNNESDRFSQNFELAVFSSRISNWIIWLPHLKGYWEPLNLELVEARGFELSASASTIISVVNINLKGNYSYTKSSIESSGGIIRSESNGMQLPFIPVHSGGVVAYAVWNGFYATYNFTHYSERFTTTSNNPNSYRRLYPYYMSSVALGKDFVKYNKKIGLQLRIDNLLNESYQTILWRPMPGRNYSLLFRVEL
ncbi:MAG TPA: TonB-dependent receptor [Tenuifilaceae bacterium]|nr:TonB-dependent receptor [Tenuifilaceae bacterium]